MRLYRSLLGGLAALALLSALPAAAQDAAAPPPRPEMGHGMMQQHGMDHAQMPAMPAETAEGAPDHAAMMARHRQMQARLEEMDARLEERMAKLQSARGEDRIDALQSLLEELVSQRLEMRRSMLGAMDDAPMHPMGHMGMADHDCPMMGAGEGMGDCRCPGMKSEGEASTPAESPGGGS